MTLAPGQLLDETTLAERFGLSRSPVREALIRLAGEELVVTLPNRSTIVAPIELATFPKYVEALDVAQRMTARLAAELRTDADLTTIASRSTDFEAALQDPAIISPCRGQQELPHGDRACRQATRTRIGFYERLLDQGRRMLHMHFEFLERTPGRPAADRRASTRCWPPITAKDADRADELGPRPHPPVPRQLHRRSVKRTTRPTSRWRQRNTRIALQILPA